MARKNSNKSDIQDKIAVADFNAKMNRQAMKDSDFNDRTQKSDAAKRDSAVVNAAGAFDKGLGKAAKMISSAKTLAGLANNPEWYAASKDALAAAASYSFNNPLGYPLDIANRVTGTGAYTPPVIMTLPFIPTPGVNLDAVSPINLSATSIYSYIRHANSGSRNYAPADLMAFYWAMDSIYMVCEWARRAYGLLRMYSQRNVAMPRAMIEASGFDFEDLQKNAPNWWHYFNNGLTARLNSICVPTVYPIFQRHRQMCRDVYLETKDPKSVSYIFKPVAVFKRDNTSSAQGGFCKMVPLSQYFTARKGQVTFVEFRQMIDDLLSAVYNDEDTGIMSGDTLKAFGWDKCYSIEPMQVDYITSPVYSAEMLGQIENAMLMPAATAEDWDSFSLKQVQANHLECAPMITLGAASGSIDANTTPWVLGDMANVVFNGYTAAPTPAEVMVSTRLMLSYKVVQHTRNTSIYNVIQIDKCGTEILQPATLYRIVDGDITPAAVDVTYVQNTDQIIYRRISEITKFNYHPRLLIAGKGGDMGYFVDGILGDLANYTLLSPYDLEKLHTTALLSLFAVPQLGVLGSFH